jgi:hypothetical protein
VAERPIGRRAVPRCGSRLPIEHAALVCGRQAGHDSEHRCTRADGSETGWAEIPPVNAPLRTHPPMHTDEGDRP